MLALPSAHSALSALRNRRCWTRVTRLGRRLGGAPRPSRHRDSRLRAKLPANGGGGGRPAGGGGGRAGASAAQVRSPRRSPRRRATRSHPQRLRASAERKCRAGSGHRAGPPRPARSDTSVRTLPSTLDQTLEDDLGNLPKFVDSLVKGPEHRRRVAPCPERHIRTPQTRGQKEAGEFLGAARRRKGAEAFAAFGRGPATQR